MDPIDITLIVAKNNDGKYTVVKAPGGVNIAAGDIIEVFIEKGLRTLCDVESVIHTQDNSELYKWISALPSACGNRVTKVWNFYGSLEISG